ncbi:hypothetical protein CCAX7_36240 [Capsulimonas corticalis]|uniref:Uncharacterized protein n=1 Tax=Capsulimonas corticalis TaxID=2219043 RepID=A0A402D6Y3_9BACT|nr:hypothetical protein [Capsulimonas corticalis]BDI31573.1 hypothetical protein CCAX7_36240 [Capsulimonas corticalis]
MRGLSRRDQWYVGSRLAALAMIAIYIASPPVQRLAGSALIGVSTLIGNEIEKSFARSMDEISKRPVKTLPAR